MNSGGPSAREQLSLSKMTPEMCRAIRRQERTTGFDYWKTGFSGINTHTAFPDRRKQLQRVTQVNLDFPGFPCLELYGKKKRKDTTVITGNGVQPFMFSRSKTSIDAPLLKSKPRGQSSKKPSFSDLTCLQLTDTIFSYSSVPFSGLGFFNRQIRPARSKYVPAISESIDNVDGVTTGDRLLDDKMQAQPDEPDGCVSMQYGHLGEVTPASYRLPSAKPQKSILKNRLINKPIISPESMAECAMCEFEPARPAVVCSYQLPSTARLGALPAATAYSHHGSRVAMDSVKPRNNNASVSSALKRHSCDASRQMCAVSINSLSDTVDGFSDRKRVVRFNAANQIHEYTPLKRLSF